MQFVLAVAAALSLQGESDRARNKFHGDGASASAQPPTRPEPPLFLQLRAPRYEQGNSFEKDATGLVLLLLESALIEFEGIVPAVAGSPRAPGLEDLAGRGQRFSLQLEIEIPDAAIFPNPATSLTLTLCDAHQRCWPRHYRGQALELAEVSARAVAEIARLLARDARGSAAVRQSAAPSPDPYAVRMLGRAAATLYELEPTRATGSRRASISRALLIDPAMPLVHWLMSRSHLAEGEFSAAIRSAHRALELAPDRLALRIGLAAVLSATSRASDAAEAWSSARARAVPHDRRFVVPHARVLHRLARFQEAASVLRSVDDIRGDASLDALRVSLAERGALDDLDGLLVAWQNSAPKNPEPVRRRIQRYLDRGQGSEALALLETFASRAPPSDALDMTLAVLANTDQWTRAVVAEAAADQRDLVRSVQIVRGSSPPSSSILSEGLEEPMVLLVRAQRLLRGGFPARALSSADRASAREPWSSEALALRWLCLISLNEPDLARDAWSRLAGADPAYASALARWARRVTAASRHRDSSTSSAVSGRRERFSQAPERVSLPVAP